MNAKGIQIGAINPLPLSTPEGIRQAIFTGRGVYTLNLIVMDEQVELTQSSKPIQVTVTCGGIKKALVPIGKDLTVTTNKESSGNEACEPKKHCPGKSLHHTDEFGESMARRDLPAV